jgi:hypothetical protein
MTKYIATLDPVKQLEGMTNMIITRMMIQQKIRCEELRNILVCKHLFRTETSNKNIKVEHESRFRQQMGCLQKSES